MDDPEGTAFRVFYVRFIGQPMWQNDSEAIMIFVSSNFSLSARADSQCEPGRLEVFVTPLGPPGSIDLCKFQFVGMGRQPMRARCGSIRYPIIYAR